MPERVGASAPVRLPGGQSPADELSNVDLVTLALHSLGGAAERIDTEDVAVRANELAPGRLTWRKYPQQINLELVRVFLSDAKKPAYGSAVIGTGRTGWMLSERGAVRALFLARQAPLAPGAVRPRHGTAADQRQRAERSWLLGHRALQDLRAKGPDALSARDLESLFRMDEYVVGEARERRIARVLASVCDDAELLAALRLAATRVRSLRKE